MDTETLDAALQRGELIPIVGWDMYDVLPVHSTLYLYWEGESHGSRTWEVGYHRAIKIHSIWTLDPEGPVDLTEEILRRNGYQGPYYGGRLGGPVRFRVQ